MLDHMGMLKSVEGTMMVRALTVGGSSMVYCGVALRPPAWLKDKHGIDLDPYVEQIEKDLGIAPLPDRLIGKAASRIQDAAREEGLNWTPLPKFFNTSLCDLSCPHCIFGCGKRAKWTARDYVDEAVGAGAKLRTGVTVEQVLYDGGRVTGVRGSGPSGPFLIEAERVILAAGGIGSAVIMRSSGFAEAGHGFFIDPLALTSGIYNGPGSSRDIPMSCGTTDFAEEGILLSEVIDPWPLWMAGLVMGGPRAPRHFLRYGNTLSIMTKSRDPLLGSIAADGTISKPLTQTELGMLRRGSEISSAILRRAGCDPSSIFTTPPRGAHPGGTVRIDDQIDKDLQTSVAGLYVCDSSVLPEPCGWPPTLTIMGLAERLVRERLS
jgi:choline dehydrogenase-like flavoprotein